MNETTLIINGVLPIFIFIALGYWIRQSGFLPAQTVGDLKKIVVNLALPSVLFISFLDVELQPKYLVLFIVLFGLCIVLFRVGVWLRQRLNITYSYYPFLITGFEYGMLGVSLFGSAYGLDKIGYLAIVDLGHEIFIWFVFLPLLLTRREGFGGGAQLFTAFIKSPVIIGILLGIIFNLLNARDFLYDSVITGAFIEVLQNLSNLTIPLILIVVGYGIQLDRNGLREALPVVILRLAILIPLALLLNIILLRGILNIEAPFEAALFTLFILPPPFILPLYMQADEAETGYVNNVLTVYTIATVIIFAIYFILNPTL